MSYRVYVNGYQCLGNNEFPEVLRKALNKQRGKNISKQRLLFYQFWNKRITTNYWGFRKIYYRKRRVVCKK